MATPRWGGLRPEPYDPDARDADGDGIVQEQTAWERPVGTSLVDDLGRAITRGAQSGTRPRGMRVVDRNGNTVDYTPTYGTAPQAPSQPGQATALADHGAGSLRERGVRDVRAISRPAPPPQQTPAAAPARAADTPKPPAAPAVEKVADGASPAGLTSASTDRPELVEPQKPRSPFKPSPPPLSGRAQEIADEADGDFGKFMELLNKEGFVVFDYETTGLQDGNIPVQIGAVRIKDGEITERFNVFTNPQRPLSDWSKENLKNKDGDPLTDEWLAGQTDLVEAHKQLAEFMGDSIIVAHNLPYDGEIIERMMKDAGVEHKPSGSIDTLMLLRSAVPKGDGETGPERHTLGVLADFFGVDLGDDAHTADADSEAAALVLQRAMDWADKNGSDSEIFDADKQKQLFDEATKKYNEQRKQYEADLKKYRSDLDEYQRAVAKAAEPQNQPDSQAPPVERPPTEVQRDVPDTTEVFTYKLRKGQPPITEPYSRHALPAEGDDIVQRGTIWERPAETYFLDNAGRPIPNGVDRKTRPPVLMGSGPDPIDYTPSYERPDYKHPLDGKPGYTIAGVQLPYRPGEDFDAKEIDSQFKAQREWLKDEADGFVDGLSDDQLRKALEALDLEDRDALVEYLTNDMVARVGDYVDEVRKGPLYVAVTPATLVKILRDKRMKSQFESGTSGGAFSPKTRVRIENALMGIPEELPDELRPIYGFQLGEEDGDSVTRSGAAIAYGSVVLKLKDNLRGRTTMVAGDSLDHALYSIPVDGDVPPERFLAAARRDYNPIWDTAMQGAMSSLTEDVLGESYDWQEPFEDIVLANAARHYNEIQVHGGVNLDDVEEVIYPEEWVQQGLYNPTFADIDEQSVNETRQQIIAALDEAKITHGEDW